MVVRPTRRAPAHRHTHARLRLEHLEDRSLLATNALAPTADSLLITARDGTLHKVLIDEGTSLDDALASYRASPDVLMAEANWKVSVSVIPNDPRFGELYGMHNVGQSGGIVDADIDAPEAWDLQQGSAGVTVGVIDTGIDYTHPDLYKNIWINQGEIPTTVRPNLQDLDRDSRITFYDLNDPSNQGLNKITDRNGNGRIDGGDLLLAWSDNTDADGNGYRDDLIGWNFITNSNNPMDDHYHGTHVAGTIGAMGNNALGVVGVNWKVQMAALKFLDANGFGSIEGAMQALQYATAMNLNISNNSWGGGGFSTPFSQALDAARARGHIFVAAAGNSANNNDSVPSYPASYPQDNIVAVAATDRRDAMAYFSSYGRNSVDIGAPGVDVLSTMPNGTYGLLSGTSMATPHVAGALALVKAQFPNDSYSELIRKVLGGANPVTSLANRTVTGGRLNVFNALKGLRVVSAVANSTTAATSVRVTFSEAINPLTFTKELDITEFIGPVPGGNVTVTSILPVVGSNDKQFDFTFAELRTGGTYTFKIGPQIANPAGALMDQDGDGRGGEPIEDTYQGSFTIIEDRTGPRVTGVTTIGTATAVSGLRVTFSEAIDPLTLRIDEQDVSVTGPAGAITITGIAPTDSTNTTFNVTFATQTATGNYSYSIGPMIADKAGNLMDQNQDGQKGQPDDVHQGTFSVLGDVTGPRVTGVTTIGTATAVSGLRVTFSEAIVGATFTTFPADLILSGPAGGIAISAITPTDSTNTTFNVTFATQTTAGTYYYSIGPMIADGKGNLMDQNQDGKKGQPDDVYQGTFAVSSSNQWTYSNNTAKTIIDWDRTTSTIYVPDNIRITDLNVKLNITHTWDSDLVIRLRSPAGNLYLNPITLINQRGGGGWNFTDSVLDDEATTPIRYGQAPFTGSYRPEQALSNFDNSSARGTWTLIIIDTLPIDEGVLWSWSLTFAGSITPFFVTPAPAPVPTSPVSEKAASLSAPVEAPEGTDQTSLAVAVGALGEADREADSRTFTTRLDTSEAPAAAAEALLPRTDPRQEARDQVLGGLARRARPPASGWSASWESDTDL